MDGDWDIDLDMSNNDPCDHDDCSDNIEDAVDDKDDSDDDSEEDADDGDYCSYDHSYDDSETEESGSHDHNSDDSEDQLGIKDLGDGDAVVGDGYRDGIKFNIYNKIVLS